MNDADIGYLPAHRLATLIREKSLSVTEIVDALLRHIVDSEPHVNAMAFVAQEQARAAAVQA
ncbi:MAG: hypothetical protein ACO1NY_05475, partial [Pseudorhodoplanes sp.]